MTCIEGFSGYATTAPVGAVSPLLKDTSVEEGWIHSVETFGTLDGPGIRYILFLSGCPLRCAYCHNPDTWQRKDGALTAVADILSDIQGVRGFLRNGGVTLSGGEPLTQSRFCKAILRGCKQMGLHTAIDTSGYLGSLADDELLADVDLVLLDIKSYDPDVYKQLTRVELEPTLAFARRLAAMQKPIWLRYVLVPGVTDDPSHIAGLAEFAAALGNVERVDVLPFHKMGENKWRDRGLDYRLDDVEPPSPELQATVRGIFAAAGLQVA